MTLSSRNYKQLQNLNCVLSQIKKKKSQLLEPYTNFLKPKIFTDEESTSISHDRIVGKLVTKTVEKDFADSHDQAMHIMQFSYLHFYELYRISFFQNTELQFDKKHILEEFRAKFKRFIRRFDKSEAFLKYAFDQGLLIIKALNMLCEVWLRFLADDKCGLESLCHREYLFQSSKSIFEDHDDSTKFLKNAKNGLFSRLSVKNEKNFEVRSIYDLTDEGLLDPKLFKQEVKLLFWKILKNKANFQSFSQNLKDQLIFTQIQKFSDDIGDKIMNYSAKIRKTTSNKLNTLNERLKEAKQILTNEIVICSVYRLRYDLREMNEYNFKKLKFLWNVRKDIIEQFW
jgi:uncharacterized protein YjaZ